MTKVDLTISGYRCRGCGKGVDYGHNVSHAKNRTRRLRLPNLHRANVLVDGKKVKTMLCTKCLRAADRPKKEVAATGGKKEE